MILKNKGSNLFQVLIYRLRRHNLENTAEIPNGQVAAQTGVEDASRVSGYCQLMYELRRIRGILMFSLRSRTRR